MCHSTESRPPAPPVVGEVAAHGPLTLTGADGTEFLAHHAVPAEPNGRKIVLLPDVRGVHPYYRDLTRRFAEAGFETVVIDYYGRSAGLGDRGDDFDWESRLPHVSPADVAADVAAARDFLGEGPVYTVGFCFGAGQSWRLSAAGLGLAGVIGFYGLPKLVEDVVGDLEAPMLLLLAGADVATSQAEFDAFTGKLDAAGVRYERHVYEGAPHSFFDRSYAEWGEACDDAWRRILAFTQPSRVDNLA
ncbi:dienelactone hydrolase family protein [Amycolatopsis australiensis]|uniref:Carboxymethylenebutenolidase n=1 Tax=Amycolatopsis australiensis TaxID=546364 RepID=A0A1K1R172_9PSEU|nr:dienelactone hydrolase family protein [Amycolatopsis australiensis]SFW65684.1 carboxymethylenebutenolidase [Amycolatopsis australiensis]